MELKLVFFCSSQEVRFSFNRTKWNWNISYRARISCPVWLLIVLNGIETPARTAGGCGGHQPFNRTKWNWNNCAVWRKQTDFSFNRTKWNWNEANSLTELPVAPLLIVLNGIETVFSVLLHRVKQAFNRTKWNWNCQPGLYSLPCHILLIVLNGIET